METTKQKNHNVHNNSRYHFAAINNKYFNLNEKSKLNISKIRAIFEPLTTNICAVSIRNSYGYLYMIRKNVLKCYLFFGCKKAKENDES